MRGAAGPTRSATSTAARHAARRTQDRDHDRSCLDPPPPPPKAAGTAAQQEHLSFLGRLGPCITRKSPNLSSQHLHHQKPPHPHFIPVVKPSTLLPTLTSNFHPPSLRPFSLQHPPKDACQLISILTSPPVARARFAGAPSSPP